MADFLRHPSVAVTEEHYAFLSVEQHYDTSKKAGFLDLSLRKYIEKFVMKSITYCEIKDNFMTRIVAGFVEPFIYC